MRKLESPLLFYLALASTRSGVATSPDTWTYLSTGRNLLAVLYGINIHILKVLRWSNALTFAATISLSAWFFRQYLRSRVLVVISLRRGSVTPARLRENTVKHGSLLILIASATFTFIMPIDDRYMAPIYILVVGLFFMALQWIGEHLPARLATYGLPPDEWTPETLSSSRDNVLVWFDPLPKCDFERGDCTPTTYTVGDLKTILEWQPEITADDGGIYRLP